MQTRNQENGSNWLNLLHGGEIVVCERPEEKPLRSKFKEMLGDGSPLWSLTSQTLFQIRDFTLTFSCNGNPLRDFEKEKTDQICLKEA